RFHGVHHLELVAARKKREGVRLLPIEPHRLEQSAVLRGALLEPGVKARLVDQVDGSGFLPAVGDEEGCEVGHAEPLASAPPLPNPLPAKGREARTTIRSFSTGPQISPLTLLQRRELRLAAGIE